MVLYPHRVFCYRSIVHALQALLEKPTFYNNCELWRNQKIPEGTLSDVYDGQNLWIQMGNRFYRFLLTLL